eukprot:7483699-Alexandrium_andersonii.AAC.1
MDFALSLFLSTSSCGRRSPRRGPRSRRRSPGRRSRWRWPPLAPAQGPPAPAAATASRPPTGCPSECP